METKYLIYRNMILRQKLQLSQQCAFEFESSVQKCALLSFKCISVKSVKHFSLSFRERSAKTLHVGLGSQHCDQGGRGRTLSRNFPQPAEGHSCCQRLLRRL